MQIGEYNGIVFELGIKDTRGLAARFHAADTITTDAMRALVLRYVALMDEIWEPITPYDYLELDDFHMVEHRHIVLTHGGLGFEAGWNASDFFNAGQPFYPPYLEFGTYKMRAQPSLGPAYRAIAPMYMSDLRETLRAAIQRLDRR